MPFGGKLRSENRWVVLTKLVPWEEIENQYAKNFADSGMGAPAKAARMGLGALILQTKLGLTDEETAVQIQENPYLQYFLEYESYRDKKSFDSFMMVYFRKRLNLKELSEINELIHGKYKKKNGSSDDKEDQGGSAGGSGKQGKLIVDGSCAPADIR